MECLHVSNTSSPWSPSCISWKPINKWTWKQNSVRFLLSPFYINLGFYMRCDHAFIISTHLLNSSHTAGAGWGGCICAHELMQKKTILSSEESTAHISEKNNTLTISFSGPLRQGQGIYMQTLQLYWAVNSPHPSKLGCSSLLWKHATGQGWKGNSFYAMTLWRIPAIQFPQMGHALSAEESPEWRWYDIP